MSALSYHRSRRALSTGRRRYCFSGPAGVALRRACMQRDHGPRGSILRQASAHACIPVLYAAVRACHVHARGNAHKTHAMHMHMHMRADLVPGGTEGDEVTSGNTNRKSNSATFKRISIQSMNSSDREWLIGHSLGWCRLGAPQASQAAPHHGQGLPA